MGFTLVEYSPQQAPQQRKGKFRLVQAASEQKSPVAQPEPSLQVRNRAGYGGMLDSMSMGFADELMGGIGALDRKFIQGDERPIGDLYADTRDAARAMMKSDAELAPRDNLGGQVLGGAMTLGVGGAASAAKTLLPKMWQGVKSGAGFGAAYGFGSGEGVEDRLKQAATGGATGAAVGGAIPAAGAVVSMPGKIARQVGLPTQNSAGKYAAREIQRIAEREGKTVAQVQSELQQLQKSNPEALVIDALGEGGGRLGRAVVNRGGKGSRELSKAIHSRQIGQNDRVTEKVGKALGDPDGYQKTLDDAIDQLRTNAKPLYDKAYAAPINYQQHGPAISRAWSRVPPRLQKSVVDAANDILISEGKQPKAIGAVIGRAQNGQVTPLPTVEQWDYIKRGLDAVIQAENTKGAAGGMSAIGRSLGIVKGDLLKEIDKAVPEFAAARKVYSDDLSVKNALELGRKSYNADAPMIAKTLQGLDSASRETFRVGYARALADQIDRAGPGQDVVARMWAAPSRRERLQAVFGTQKTFAQFAEFASGEAKMRKSYNALGSNSTTAQQLNDMGDSGLSGVEPFVQAAQGNFGGAAVSAIRKLVQTSAGLTERRADEIARVLASPSIPQGTMTRAGQYQMSGEQRAELSRLIRNAGSRAAVVGSTGQ